MVIASRGSRGPVLWGWRTSVPWFPDLEDEGSGRGLAVWVQWGLSTRLACLGGHASGENAADVHGGRKGLTRYMCL